MQVTTALPIASETCPEFLRIERASEIFSMSRSTIRALIAAGKLRRYSPEGMRLVLIKTAELRDLLEQNTGEVGAE